MSKMRCVVMLAALAGLILSGQVMAGMKLKVKPTTKPDLAPGKSIVLTLSDKKSACSGSYSYSFDPPPVGTAALSGNQLLYVNDGTNGYLVNSKSAYPFKVYMHCSLGGTVSKAIQPLDSGAGGSGGGGGGSGGGGTGSGGGGSTGSGSLSTGKVILDNTSSPNSAAIGANLIFVAGGSKGATAIETGVGGNAINITDFQTLVRDTGVNPHDLQLYIGNNATVVSDKNFGTKKAFNFFAAGQHLFDLNRLRSTADWLSMDKNGDLIPDNITPDPGVPYGTYGTLSMHQFLDNIVNGRTMYGMVRVKVPLQLNSGAGGTGKNALNKVVNANTIYGFCSSTVGLCACAPGTGFKSIKRGTAACGMTMPSTAKVKVKGALLWDFVDNLTGNPIPLAQLPFIPRALYFKVEIPIMVDWSGDLNDDGAVDNMPYIKSLTGAMTGTSPINITNTITPIDFLKVTASAKAAYRFATGKVLTAADFALLNRPTQYHMLMPSGYESGWADAFNKLNLTAKTWNSLPPATCVSQSGGNCSKFAVPPGMTGIMSADDIRSGGFEDIPTYMYSGGLIDMHSHVNISGLVYVPQGMELEAKSSTDPTQQYVYGAVVVRDTFYIEAKTNTITVFSSAPETYSTALTTLTSSSTKTGPTFSSLTYNGTTASGGSGGGGSTPPPPPAGGTLCLGCSGGSGGAGSGGTGGAAGAVRWVEIRPQI